MLRQTPFVCGFSETWDVSSIIQTIRPIPLYHLETKYWRIQENVGSWLRVGRLQQQRRSTLNVSAMGSSDLNLYVYG